MPSASLVVIAVTPNHSDAEGAPLPRGEEFSVLRARRPAFRRDDPDFAALVGTSFALMARYRRWFLDRLPDGEEPDLPMSAQLTEMGGALGRQPD